MGLQGVERAAIFPGYQPSLMTLIEWTPELDLFASCTARADA